MLIRWRLRRIIIDTPTGGTSSDVADRIARKDRRGGCGSWVARFGLCVFVAFDSAVSKRLSVIWSSCSVTPFIDRPSIIRWIISNIIDPMPSRLP